MFLDKGPNFQYVLPALVTKRQNHPPHIENMHMLLAGSIFFVSTIMLSGSGEAVSSAGPTMLADSLKLGDAAPPFVMRDLITADKVVYMRDWVGKTLRKESKVDRPHVVVLSFWATWCEPCKIEIPLLTKLSEEFKGQPVKIFLINTMEYSGVTEDTVRAVYQRRNYSLDCLIDGSGRVSRQYTVRGLPMIVVIDQDGNVRKVNRGYHENFHIDLRQMIQSLLKSSNPTVRN